MQAALGRIFADDRPTLEKVARAAGLVVWWTAPIWVLTPWGPRVFWTVAVAALPLFWLVGGYALWRRLCPLAITSRLGTWLDRPGRLKIGGAWAANALAIQLVLMVVCLAARLVGLNGTSWALSLFLIALNAVAIGVGLRYTGRTWCHAVCPLGVVERIYTEPTRLVGTSSSQCSPCTACRKRCPDIDPELGYWKETEDRARHVAYLTWPGIVVAFYLFYWLQAGEWDWYFSGDWTDERRQLVTAAQPLALLPLPRWLAAPVVLGVGGLASYGLFEAGRRLALARWPNPELVRHRTHVLAGFVSFNAFYLWAGQPTLQWAPRWVQTAVGFTVVATSTLVLVQRWRRREQDWVREKFARRLSSRWTHGEAPVGATDSELALVHEERQRAHQTNLDAYRETLRELAAEGVVDRGGLAVLGAVRARLGLTDAEHDKVVAQLEVADRALFDADSGEEALQRRQYRQALERALTESAHEAVIAQLRRTHGISEDDHAAILAELRDPSGALAKAVQEQRDQLDRLRGVAAAALAVPNAEAVADLVQATARWRGRAHAERIRALSEVKDDDPLLAWVDGGPAGEPGALEAGRDDPLLRPAITLLLSAEATPTDGWGWPLPVEPRWADLSELERQVVLRAVDLFRSLAPPALLRLARDATARGLQADEDLCRAGDPGDEVFVVLTGELRVWLDDRTLRICGRGEVLGELAVLDQTPRSASVTATGPTEVVVVAGAAFRGLLRDEPELYADVVAQLARRLKTVALRR